METHLEKIFRKEVVETEKISGLTNINTIFIFNDGYKVISRPLSGYEKHRTMATKGLAGRTYGKYRTVYFSEFYEGKILKNYQLDTNIDNILTEMARFHQSSGWKDCNLVFWQEVQKMMNIIEAETLAKIKITSDQFQVELDLLRILSRNKKADVVFTHNDLHPGNMVSTVDGKIKFIDYEYCGLNYRSYELANFFNEFMGFEVNTQLYPNMETQKKWLKKYCQLIGKEDMMDNLLDEIPIFTIFSHFFWTLWALVQYQRFTGINFNYLDYAKKRFGLFISKKKELF